MNTKTLKTVMIADKQSWEGGGGGRGGRARGASSCLLSISVQPCPPRRGAPAEPRGLARGGRHKSMGAGGTSTPSEAQGAGQKGDYKSQETTKLNTKVGTAGQGRERGGERRGAVLADCPSGARGRAGPSDLVVDVRWALGRHLLDDVDGVPVVPTHLLIVGAVVVLCSP